jgi:hypothetical protein
LILTEEVGKLAPTERELVLYLARNLENPIDKVNALKKLSLNLPRSQE